MQEHHDNDKKEPHNHSEYLLLYKEAEIPALSLGRFLECQECNIHICYNTDKSALPDIYTLTLRSAYIYIYIYIYIYAKQKQPGCKKV